MKPETLLIGVYPRDDVKWPKDGRVRRGLIEVVTDDGDVVASQQMGEFFPPLSPDLDVDQTFLVRVTASDGGDAYAQEFSFVVTGDEDDVDHYTVGPGIKVERGSWGRKNVTGFEFGATVMGARRDG
jgi:hypothetical protein